MAPTTSHYMHTITRNDREVSVEKGFKGEDFLNSWAMSNAEELVAHEREDEETKLRLEKDRVREQTMRKGPISEAEARKRELKTRAKWRRKAKASAKPRKPEKGKVQLSKKDQKMRNETGGKRNVKFARGRKMRDHGGRRQRTTKNTTEAAQ